MLIAARQFFTGKKLPYDAEVEYLESTGTQCIDTGIRCEADVGFSIDALFPNAPVAGTYPVVIGAQYSDYSHWISVWAENTELRAGTESSTISIPFFTRFAASLNFNNSQRVVVGAQSVNITTRLITANIGIFCAGDENGFSTFSASRVYSVQITKGNNIVRDFVPVRFTNELGQSEGAMYDKVSGELFRNQGTGSFTIGSDKN